jgi:chitin disaccharide deacetylase
VSTDSTPSGGGNGADSKAVVVNADDFGASSGVNHGIIRAHEHGIVTSASLMVGGAAAAEAAAYARGRPGLGLGLHVEVRHWRVRRLRPAARSERALRASVSADVARQLEEFVRLVGRTPTHLDSHHHRHRIEPLLSVFLEVAGELDVPLRHFTRGVRFCGAFYGHDGKGRPKPQGITPRALIALLEGLETGITELASHPGYPDGLKAWYRDERVTEVETLCDRNVRDAVSRLDIALVSFPDVAARREAGAAAGGRRWW